MSTQIEFPEFYQGIYQRTQPAYGPLIAEAIERLRATPVPRHFRPFLGYMVWENPQPSFILLPFMYLATAEASGGITQRHKDYLPTIMLTAELCAVADDTVDRALHRSGRMTFPARFGDASSVPMAGALLSMILERSRENEALFDAVRSFYMDLFALELWEREHAYADPSLFDTWLEHRYEQAIVATGWALNSALILSDRPLWPRAAVAPLAQIGQDVDDIVNLIEYRESDGENDDLQSGIVTRPLIYAIREVPELADDVVELWAQHRALASRQLPIAELQARRAEITRATLPLYASIRRVILQRGVPLAVKQCLVEYEASVRESPPSLRPLMSDLSSAFLDRLRRCRYFDLDVEVGAAACARIAAELG